MRDCADTERRPSASGPGPLPALGCSHGLLGRMLARGPRSLSIQRNPGSWGSATCPRPLNTPRAPGGLESLSLLFLATPLPHGKVAPSPSALEMARWGTDLILGQGFPTGHRVRQASQAGSERTCPRPRGRQAGIQTASAGQSRSGWASLDHLSQVERSGQHRLREGLFFVFVSDPMRSPAPAGPGVNPHLGFPQNKAALLNVPQRRLQSEQVEGNSICLLLHGEGVRGWICP